MRRAVEMHAVARAIAYYRKRGWHVEAVGSTESYDLRLSLNGTERHVEVKGSSQTTDEVELTIGEVAHSRQRIPSDLFIVDQIAYTPDASGGHSTRGTRTSLDRLATT